MRDEGRKRILIVEVNWLGDVLFSTAAIRALRKKYPDSFIACLAVPRVKEVLQGNPNIDEIVVNDEDGIYKGLAGKLRLAGELKKKRFDAAILFHRSLSRTIVTWLAGIPERIGYNTYKRWLFLTRRITPPRRDGVHRVDLYLNLVKHLGCLIEDKFYEFFTSPEDEAFISQFFKSEGIAEGDFTVCLNPGGNWPPKRWAKENFAYLADHLINEYKAKVIFSGSQKDIALVEEIRSMMKNKAVSACGRTTLKQSGCLFRKSSLMICADTGPLHIAAAMGTDIIALFGPTSAAITGPKGKGRIKVIRKGISCPVPCYNQDCADNHCMSSISVEDVLKEVRGLLKR